MTHIADRDAVPSPVTARTQASLIVPVFNSQQSLRQLHRTIVEYTASPEFDIEIVYVDDNSTDGSLDILRDIEAHAAKVRVVAQPRNRGQSGALLAGILAARNDIVVTLDDDLQHRPRDIARLLAALDGASSRTLAMGIAETLKRPLWRAGSGLAANMISNLFLAKPLPSQMTTLCAFRRQLCADLDPASDEPLPLMTALVQAAEVTRTVPISLDSSLRGGSRYGVAALFRLFMSRSRYYKLSRVLAWLAVASLLMAASAALLLTPAANHHSVQTALLLAVPAAFWLMLALLAIKVARRSRAAGLLPTNRPM